MSAALRIPAMMAWLTILWVALWGSISWGNVVGGLLVSAGVVVFARLDSSTLRPTRFRPHWAIWYVVVVGAKLVTANLRLAYEILTPKDGTRTAIVAVPMRGGSDAVVNLVANSITLTPGTMTIDVKTHDPDGDDPLEEGTTLSRVTLYVHGMFAHDLDAVRLEVLELEALALRAFGSDEDYELAKQDISEHLERVRTEKGNRS